MRGVQGRQALAQALALDVATTRWLVSDLEVKRQLGGREALLGRDPMDVADVLAEPPIERMVRRRCHARRGKAGGVIPNDAMMLLHMVL